MYIPEKQEEQTQDFLGQIEEKYAQKWITDGYKFYEKDNKETEQSQESVLENPEL